MFNTLNYRNLKFEEKVLITNLLVIVFKFYKHKWKFKQMDLEAHVNPVKFNY